MHNKNKFYMFIYFYIGNLQISKRINHYAKYLNTIIRDAN